MKSVRECVFSTDLDVMTLVCTRGRDMPITYLQQRLKCPHCGSHHKFRKGDRTVIVPHPKKDLPQGTAKAIAKQAGWE